jgi:O-antigen/teichoic acid export membrane protein
MTNKSDIIQGISYISALQIFQKIFSGLTLIILSWYLTAKDFGIVALSLFFYSFLVYFEDLGVNSAIIQRDKNIEAAIHAGMFIRISTGFVLTLIGFVLVPLIILLYNSIEIAQTFIVINLFFIIGSIGFIPRVMLTKELKFDKIAITGILSNISYCVIAIIFVYFGFRYWSITLGYIASVLFSNIYFWKYSKWKYKLLYDKKIIMELINYGKFSIVYNILFFLTFNIDKTIIGKLLGLNSLGFYTMAQQWVQIIPGFFMGIANTVLFPSYSIIKNDENKMKKGFIMVSKYLLLFIAPLVTGFALVADIFVPVIIGTKWIQSIPIFQIMCFYALFLVLGNQAGNVLFAIGKQKLLRLTIIANIVPLILILILIYLAILWNGIIGSAIIVTIGSFIYMSILIISVYRELKIKISETIKWVLYPIIISLIIGLTLFLIKIFIINTTDLFTLSILIIIGIFIYSLILYIIFRSRIITIIKQILTYINPYKFFNMNN